LSNAALEATDILDNSNGNQSQQQYAMIQHQAELEFLSSLITDIIADIDEMKYVKSWSTKRGIVCRVSGVVFSAILLVWLTATLLNVSAVSNNNVPTLPLVTLVLMAHTTAGDY
jgi:hypothetical protein